MANASNINPVSARNSTSFALAVLLALASALFGVALQSSYWMASSKKEAVSHCGLWTWCAPGEKSLILGGVEGAPCSMLNMEGATAMFKIFGSDAPEEKARLLVASQVLAVVACGLAVVGAGLAWYLSMAHVRIAPGMPGSKILPGLHFVPAAASLASFVTSLLAVIFYANLFRAFAQGLKWSAWPGQALDRSEVRTSLTFGWIFELLGCITAGLSTLVSIVDVSITIAPSFSTGLVAKAASAPGISNVVEGITHGIQQLVKGATETGEPSGERERETTARRRTGTGAQ